MKQHTSVPGKSHRRPSLEPLLLYATGNKNGYQGDEEEAPSMTSSTSLFSSSSSTTGESGDEGDKASIPNLTTSLVKSIVGSGVFALPAGVAAMTALTTTTPEVVESAAVSSSSPDALLTTAAIVIIVAVGAMNAYFFSLVGRVCHVTGAMSYKQAWERTFDKRKQTTLKGNNNAYENNNDSGANGGGGGVWIAWVVTLKTFLSCLAYEMILADSFASLAKSCGWDDVISRNVALLLVTIVALLPLSLLPDLKALAPFSFLGLLGIALAAVMMTIRWLDGSYAVMDVVTTATTTSGGLHWSGALVLACTLATAFVAHYNAPRFFSELDQPTTQRFDIVTYIAFALSAVFYVYVALIGYWTFGTESSGFILNNYSTIDPLVTLSRFAIALSITLSYPLPFTGLRDGVMDLLTLETSTNNSPRTTDEREDITSSSTLVSYSPSSATTTTTAENMETESDKKVGRKNGISDDFGAIFGGVDQARTAISVGLLALVTLVASQVTDLGLVLTVGGGTFSTVISAVFPTLMFCAAAGASDMDTAKLEYDQSVDAEEKGLEQKGLYGGSINFSTTGGEMIIRPWETKLALILMCASITIGATGTFFALQKSV